MTRVFIEFPVLAVVQDRVLCICHRLPRGGDPGLMWVLCKRLVQLPHLLRHYFYQIPRIVPGTWGPATLT